MKGFTARWNIKRLVWFEMHDDMDAAIKREKQVKRWLRQWKYDLVTKNNPTWRDLAEDFGCPPLPLGEKRQAPGQARGDD